jgi:hypothetical protein
MVKNLIFPENFPGRDLVTSEGNVVFGRIFLNRIELSRKLNGPNGCLGRKNQTGRKIF